MVTAVDGQPQFRVALTSHEARSKKDAAADPVPTTPDGGPATSGPSSGGPAISGPATPAAQVARPNVLFLLADDLRPQLGVYGRRASTPNLDQLAAQGTTFERAYAQITVCNPSRASFLSGRRPDTTEIYGFEAASPPGWTTLPALFRRQGYTTFGVGKVFHWGPGPADAWTNEVAVWDDGGGVDARGEVGSEASEEASSSQVRWAGAAAALGPGGGAWETPAGGVSAGLHRAAATLPKPATNENGRFSVGGFWPFSDEFQAMKGAEQDALLSTMHPEPEPGEDGRSGRGRGANGAAAPAAGAQTTTRIHGLHTAAPPPGPLGPPGAGAMSLDAHRPLRADRDTLPFRDGVYASRARRLLSLAAAQRELDGGPKPWLLMVGFSLPHEPVRFPQWAWDLYSDDDDDRTDGVGGLAGNRSAVFGGGATRSDGNGFGVRRRRGLHHLPVAAAPHPLRPLGSPIFAFGDLKERFVYYDQGSQQQRKLALKVHYGPSTARRMPVDPQAPVLDRSKEAVKASRGQSRMAAYAEKLTRGSRGQASATVKGDDYFGILDSEVWADSSNAIGERSLPLDARKELARGYSAACSFLDYQVGRVLSALEALPHDAAAHTVVVFTADHGFSLGDQGGWGKRTLWETDARVPLLVRPPPRLPWLRGRVAAAPLGVGAAAGSAFGLEGARSRALVELVDLFPTLAELARLGHDPLLVATAAAARASARAVPAAAAAARPDDSAAALAEPPLDGTSFAHLLYPPDNARRSRRAAAGEARRAASQFPRCPVKVSRAGVRKCLLSEPWRSSGAGGFECQGRSSDWPHNHELAVMGYSMRSLGWRLTAWVRVVGYAQPTPGSAVAVASANASKAKPAAWLHGRLVANWTWPPYFAELYDHRAEDYDDGGGEGGEAAAEERAAEGAAPRAAPGLVLRPPPGSRSHSSNANTAAAAPSAARAASIRLLLASGGGFDLSEAANVASRNPEIAQQLFKDLKGLFDRGLR